MGPVTADAQCKGQRRQPPAGRRVAGSPGRSAQTVLCSCRKAPRAAGAKAVLPREAPSPAPDLEKRREGKKP